MQQLVTLYDKLSDEDERSTLECATLYIRCLVNVCALPQGHGSVVFRDLIQKGRFSPEIFLKADKAVEEGKAAHRERVCLAWFTHWSGVDPMLLRNAMSVKCSRYSARSIKAIYSVALFRKDSLVFLGAMIILVAIIVKSRNVPHGILRGDTEQVKASLEPPERNLIAAAQTLHGTDPPDQETVHACLNFIRVWVHSNRSLVVFGQLDAQFAARVVGTLRHTIGIFVPLRHVAGVPEFAGDDGTTLVSADGTLAARVGNVRSWQFWTLENLTPFICTPQHFEHLLHYGPLLMAMRHGSTPQPSSVDDNDDVETEEDDSSSPSGQQMIVRLKRKSPLPQIDRLKRLIEIGSTQMLTLEESLELMTFDFRALVRDHKHLMMREVSYYVPPELWRQFSEVDKRCWAERTVEHGFIPPARLQNMMDWAPSRCSQHYDYHEEARLWHFWNHKKQKASYLTCFRCQANQRRSTRGVKRRKY